MVFIDWSPAWLFILLHLILYIWMAARIFYSSEHCLAITFATYFSIQLGHSPVIWNAHTIEMWWKLLKNRDDLSIKLTKVAPSALASSEISMKTMWINWQTGSVCIGCSVRNFAMYCIRSFCHQIDSHKYSHLPISFGHVLYTNAMMH